jgi:hypothetical protein
MKPCPLCAESIEDAARKCKHCGEYLDPSARPASVAEVQVEKKREAARTLNLMSWCFGVPAILFFALGAQLPGALLGLIAVLLSVGVHLKRAA